MNRLIILLMSVLVFAGCSTETKQIEKEVVPENNYADTRWTAVDDIAELIYGKTCTTTIEFFDDFKCQEINKRTGMSFGAGTYVEEGTYKLKGDSVSWTIGKTTITGKAKGSVLMTNMGTISGGKRNYNKD